MPAASRQRIVLILALLGCVVPPAPAQHPVVGVEDFTFLHISDTHINPHVARLGPPEKPRGAECIEWICAEAGKPQEMRPFKMTVAPPSFAIVTGDLTEYGVIDDTWDQWEAAFRCLPFKTYVTTGNHDNTWTAIYQVMRTRHGGENYSFNQHGCHFAIISSASPQEPVPTIDGKTRAWLMKDLEEQPPERPIFVALHHPPYSDEFAPAELDTLIDLLRNYNVALLLYGHGHGVAHWSRDGIDGVMGGSTFGGNEGYGIVSVKDGVLRVAYRYRQPGEKKPDADPGSRYKKLLEKPLRSRRVPRLLDMLVEDNTEKPNIVSVALRLSDGLTADAKLDVLIDGSPVEAANLSWRRDEDGRPTGVQVDTSAMTTPGRRLLAVRATVGEQTDQRVSWIELRRPTAEVQLMLPIPGAVKAGVVRTGDMVIVSGTDGDVRAYDAETGSLRWHFHTRGEVLAAPLVTEDACVFGSGDGHIYALDHAGKVRWIYQTGVPCYAPIVRDGAVIYAADNGGRVHAITLDKGIRKWVFERADYSIEAAPVIWKDKLVFGAWDGHLYALSREDGKEAWKSLGPESSKGRAVRYFSPADCPPVPIGDRLFVCDRGYKLGVYSADGKLERELGERISAISAARNEQGETVGFYARSSEGDKLTRFDAAGEPVWQVDVPTGRFPVPPTEHRGKVYICSNRGLLSVLNAADGKILWQYQITPGYFVMAPVTVADNGTVYVGGMDGLVMALRSRQ